MLFMLSVVNKLFMLRIFILNVVTLGVANKPYILSVIMLNVIILSVVAPFLQRQEPDKESVENMQMTNLKIRAREGMTI
jgi:hypothetical protein